VHHVVVGASLAGIHAVEGLRDAGFDGELTLVGAENTLPYDRPPLSKASLRFGPTAGGIPLRPSEWYAAHAVDLRLGCTAVKLDLASRSVSLDDGGEVSYDGLVLATGSSARPLATPAGVGPAYVLRTAGDCARLHARLQPGQHLVVIGAGFIGLEVAATAKTMGLEVSVVELAPVPLHRVLGAEVGGWFDRHHAAHGISMHCGVGIEAIEADGHRSKVLLRNGTVLAADVLVAGIGAQPAIDWLRDSGLRLSDGVACDPFLRTSAPNVVAAGDIARWHNTLFDEDLRVEQWTNAVEQGRYAAQSLLGIAAEAYAPVPYFWSDQFDAKMRFVGVANAAEDIHVDQVGPDVLVALFGRDGLLRGALCVNAPRKLAQYRQAIVDRVPWRDVIPQ
jgi:NADPH-dependent 2,4-dienoyl-CoA reductase/sulfur reductase-like enzyme